MGLFALFLTAVGLSMDAFAVSASNGMCYRDFRRGYVFLSALTFGLFQALMPLAGYFAGNTFSAAISSFDHWIALLLLGVIGGKMLFDGIQELRSSKACKVQPSYNCKAMLIQAIATSIDAFAVGVGFAVMDVQILIAAPCIGIITFCCSLLGCTLGRKFGVLLGRWAQVAGGCILIAIGLNIFLEHMLA